MRCSLKILSGALLAAGLLLAAVGGCGPSGESAGSSEGSEAPKPPERIVIAMCPKLINIDYFNACERGARKAAAELGVTLIYDGPKQASGAEQNNFMSTWIRQRVDAICIAPNQPKAVRSFVERAQREGIKVLTWDTDAPESGRDLMVNQVDDRLLGEMLMDELARQMGEEGQWAIAIGSLDAANLNTWRRHAEARARERYPRLELAATELTREDENYAREKVEALLNARPELKGILAFDSNSVPGAAEALVRTGKAGKVALVGNSTPAKMKRYIKEGVLECFFLWDPRALGDLTVRCAKALVDGIELREGVEIPPHGRLTFSASDPKMVILSEPIRFTRDNIDLYDFGI
jgi:rhamnose transport system substrate-binding protein